MYFTLHLYMIISHMDNLIDGFTAFSTNKNLPSQNYRKICNIKQELKLLLFFYIKSSNIKNL